MIWPFKKKKKIVVERMRLGLFGHFAASPAGFDSSQDVAFGRTREDAVAALIAERPDLKDAKVVDKT